MWGRKVRAVPVSTITPALRIPSLSGKFNQQDKKETYMTTLTRTFILLGFLALIGCDSDTASVLTGGGGDNDYGSIAAGWTTDGRSVGALETGSSPSDARSKALAACRSESETNCRSIEYGPGQCGSAAISTDSRTVGVGTGNSISEAQNRAIAECRSAGGENCRIVTTTSGNAITDCRS